jgi:hypothetical protein
MIDSGLRYCVTHNGVVDVDEDSPCDFSAGLDDSQPDCLLVPLLYKKPKNRRGP